MAMVSPLIEILSQSQTPKGPRHAVEPAYERNMDDFTVEVCSRFEEPGANRLMQLSEGLKKEFGDRLKHSEISMLPSYNHTLPTGDETGDFLALDVGGSTFRVALCQLGGRERGENGMCLRRIRSFVIDENIRRLPGQAFFDWMADRIGEMLAEYNHIKGTTNAMLPMGLAWSFPIQQTSPRSGRLLAMGKGFHATLDVEGQDLSEIIMRSCRRKGLNVAMRAIVNDSAATLLSQAYRDSSARMSLIFGTGMNAALYLPVTALSPEKFGSRPASWHAAASHVLVNTELSMFGKNLMPVTRWDNILNAAHKLPDFQPMEYLLAGRYLGEIVRLILVEAIETAGLFDGEWPEHFDEPYSFDTRIVAAFESDASSNLANACSLFLRSHRLRSRPRRPDLLFIQTVARLVSRRAQAYLATAIHALVSLRTAAEGNGTGNSRHVTVACDGAIMQKYPGFHSGCQRYLDELCALSGGSKSAVTLEMVPDSSIYGAAVAVSCIKDV